MADRDQRARRDLTDAAFRRAERVVALAWQDLPRDHQLLLRNVRADRWQVTSRPLGGVVDELLRSADLDGIAVPQRLALDRALGVWVQALVLIDAGHPQYGGLDERSFEAALARVAWHEWAHALAVARATSDDIGAGGRLLERAPEGVREGIRRAGYRRRVYTHELVAETYALLMARRRRGWSGQPPWLDGEIYELVRRVCGWNQ